MLDVLQPQNAEKVPFFLQKFNDVWLSQNDTAGPVWNYRRPKEQHCNKTIYVRRCSKAIPKRPNKKAYLVISYG